MPTVITNVYTYFTLTTEAYCSVLPQAHPNQVFCVLRCGKLIRVMEQTREQTMEYQMPSLCRDKMIL